MNRDRIAELRIVLEGCAQALDLALLAADQSESEATYEAAVARALCVGHAIADRLEAFASEDLPQIGAAS